MGWEVSTPYSAYPRKPRPRMKSAMTEYSLRTKQTLQSGLLEHAPLCHGDGISKRQNIHFFPSSTLSSTIVKLSGKHGRCKQKTADHKWYVLGVRKYRLSQANERYRIVSVLKKYHLI